MRKVRIWDITLSDLLCNGLKGIKSIAVSGSSAKLNFVIGKDFSTQEIMVALR